MADEEPKPLNYVSEIVLKKRKSNEDWANRRKEQLEQRVKKSKRDNFVIKKPEQFIREYRDKVNIHITKHYLYTHTHTYIYIYIYAYFICLGHG